MHGNHIFPKRGDGQRVQPGSIPRTLLDAHGYMEISFVREGRDGQGGRPGPVPRALCKQKCMEITLVPEGETARGCGQAQSHARFWLREIHRDQPGAVPRAHLDTQKYVNGQEARTARKRCQAQSHARSWMHRNTWKSTRPNATSVFGYGEVHRHRLRPEGRMARGGGQAQYQSHASF